MPWTPYDNMSKFQDRISHILCGEKGPAGECSFDKNASWQPPVDIYEDDGGLVFLVDLPGVEKEAVCVEIKGQTLTIKGERAGVQCPPKSRGIRTERCFGAFHRSFTLGREMDPKKIRAAFSKGVLMVTVLHPEVDPPKKVPVFMEKKETTS